MSETHPQPGGLEPGGGVPPGETPPAEGSESWAGGRAYRQPDVPHATFWSRAAAFLVVGTMAVLGVAFLAWAVLRAVYS